MSAPNLFYAQSGGVTAVINTTAYGVIDEAKQHTNIGNVFVGINGILGALNEELCDVGHEQDEQIKALRHTPGGAFGSCRYKLKDPSQNDSEYKRLIEVFAAHNIGYMLYNGGGDSQDTTHKLNNFSKEVGYDLRCIGIPKTIDNDLPETDNSPGFATAAKYIATSTLETSLDVASMCATSTKVFILEVMGRHAGWLAASAGLAQNHTNNAPHIILFPEVAFEMDSFLAKVKYSVENQKFCLIVASEGVRNATGDFLAAAQSKDAFGHSQLGGVAPYLAQIIQERLGYKNHWAVADYMQRASRHLGSAVDVAQAEATGRTAVQFAAMGKSDVMPVIKRISNKPYQWSIESAPLNIIANQEKYIPRNWISEDGFSIMEPLREYLQPLIQGEDYPPYNNGVPIYAHLELKTLPKKLPAYKLNK